MLTQIGRHKVTDGRNLRRERRLWYDVNLTSQPLGCATCPDLETCGGLQVRSPIFDCLTFCCDNPNACDKVCRRNPDYVNRVREIGSFALSTVPRSPILSVPALPTAIPMIYGKGSRSWPAKVSTVALPLSRMFGRKDGAPRYKSRAEVCASYCIDPGALIVLSGTDHDSPIERWWGIGVEQRRSVIKSLLTIGVALTTTPNYSLFTDSPRWDDLHAMKRIALVHQEFLSEGLPAALHVNGRTETDFKRWTEYIAARPEVTHVAYEFTTGTGSVGRREQHAAWLCELANALHRPITLLVRGGIAMLPMLATTFSHVTLIDTSSIMKAVYRQRASLTRGLRWESAPTRIGQAVDDLFHHNVDTIRAWVEQVVTPTIHG